jgi:hypothetical protein
MYLKIMQFLEVEGSQSPPSFLPYDYVVTGSQISPEAQELKIPLRFGD